MFRNRTQPTHYGMTYTHPERRDGEVWITNETLESFHIYDHQTKRLGEVAYDIWGQPVAGLYPIFANEAELNSKGIVFIKPNNLLDCSNFESESTFDLSDYKRQLQDVINQGRK